MQNPSTIVSHQQGETGKAIKFIDNSGFRYKRFDSIAIRQTTPQNGRQTSNSIDPESPSGIIHQSNIIYISRSGHLGPNPELYANDSRSFPFILIGVKKGSQITVAEEFNPGISKTIWDDAHVSDRSMGWSKDYQIVGLDIRNHDGKELITLLGKGEKVYVAFRFAIEKEGTLGVAGVKAGNNRYDVHLYSLADPDFGWLPFPINQSGNPLLI